MLFRSSGRDFTDADALALHLLRPHLIALDARQLHRHQGTPDPTPRQRQILALVAAGLGDTQIAPSDCPRRQSASTSKTPTRGCTSTAGPPPSPRSIRRSPTIRRQLPPRPPALADHPQPEPRPARLRHKPRPGTRPRRRPARRSPAGTYYTEPPRSRAMNRCCMRSFAVRRAPPWVMPAWRAACCRRAPIGSRQAPRTWTSQAVSVAPR
jgi:hypothetical protein